MVVVKFLRNEAQVRDIRTLQNALQGAKAVVYAAASPPQSQVLPKLLRRGGRG